MYPTLKGENVNEPSNSGGFAPCSDKATCFNHLTAEMEILRCSSQKLWVLDVKGVLNHIITLMVFCRPEMRGGKDEARQHGDFSCKMPFKNQDRT